MAAHVVEAAEDPHEHVGRPVDDGAGSGRQTRPGPEPALVGAARTGVGMVPVVGSAGVLVLLMSAASVEGLRRVAQAWTGPVLVVGSAEEAREVIGTDVTEGAGPEGSWTGSPQPVPPDLPGDAEADEDGGTDELRLDADRQVMTHAGAEAALTPLEFGLLSVLLDRPGRVRRFEQLTEEVWGTRHIGDAAPVHSVVKRLRRKLELLGAPVQLQAVRGIGFRLAQRSTLTVVDP